MALLANAQDAGFAFVREVLNVSDSDLSKQAAALADAGYLVINKSGLGRGATTVFRIKQSGKGAYNKHKKALAELLSGKSFVVGNE